MELVAEAQVSGASRERARDQLGISARTVDRWISKSEDMRKGPITRPKRAMSP